MWSFRALVRAHERCDEFERIFRAVGGAFFKIPLDTSQLIGYMRDTEHGLLASLSEGVKRGGFHFDGKHTLILGGGYGREMVHP